MKITKAEFRTLATEAIDRLCDLPDEIWQATLPVMRLTLTIGDASGTCRDTIVVGVVGDTDADPDASDPAA